MKIFCTLFLLFFCSISFSQEADTSAEKKLQPVIIRAFEQNRQLRDVPAAVNYLDQRVLNSFNLTSIVQAVNTTPGVRMEERSPGSYRFNIRGSSLRSPFGVRNVKVYYNDIPFTDPGGHSYLNALGFYNFSSLEIIKGPGSSLYGAGTGGVLLIESRNANENEMASVEYTQGSYGLKNIYGAVSFGRETAQTKLSFQHQESDGYRNHSGLERNIVSWSGRYKIGESDQMKTTFLYSDLFYETPGALTKAEYDLDPKLSRPAGGGFPGAEQARAAIQQKTFLAGLSNTHSFSESFTNTTTAYGTFTELRNPAVRNYGKNSEPHFGGRSIFSYKKELPESRWHITAGGEFQKSFSTTTAYKNKNGNPDTLQTEDDVPIRQTFAFLQAAYEQNGWELMAGGSLNFVGVEIRRTAPFPQPVQKTNFNNELAPRVSLSKKFRAVTIYSGIAKGFSPPTSAELLPSGSSINLNLSAERGINYDLGFRGLLKNLSFDINTFYFSLQNTIAQRRDAGGGDFYVNAGKTSQYGIETSITHPLLKKVSSLRQGIFWFSHTWHQFRYEEFKQLTSDFSGKRLPGVAPHTVSTGVDFSFTKGFLLNVNYYYSDRVPLNDANLNYAEAYHLLNAKIGFEKPFDKWKIRIGAGAENLLDESYSLGNDINAFGGRFYNAAPKRNFYFSVAASLLKRKPSSL